jgi:hypothetical protein
LILKIGGRGMVGNLLVRYNMSHARASWLMKAPKGVLYITTIGGPRVGKTTVLCFLAEMLDRDGIVCSHGKKPEINTVCLDDRLLTMEQWEKVRQLPNVLTIKVCNNKIDGITPTPQRIADTEFFINNDRDFRFLEVQLKDLYEAEIKNHLKWKQAFGS